MATGARCFVHLDEARRYAHRLSRERNLVEDDVRIFHTPVRVAIPRRRFA